MADRGLIGREAEFGQLVAARIAAERGEGSLVLVHGDAGVGKTCLCEAVAEAGEGWVARGAAVATARSPHGAIVGALRAFRRAEPTVLDGCGQLRPHLALLLPELGEPATSGNREALLEAIRCAFLTITEERPAVVILDDLQWSDDATLDLLGALSPFLSDLPLLILAAYRSDEIPRGHALRRMRDELRRAGCLVECSLDPLDCEQTGELVAGVLAQAPSSSLVRMIYDRTQGIPFFVEELTAALDVGNVLEEGRRGLELAQVGEIPMPSTIRDAVVMRVADLGSQARAAAEIAAVAGERFDLSVVAALADGGGLAELGERGLIVEAEDGHGCGRFRHALVREALYAEIPWLRRQSLHRDLVNLLDREGVPRSVVALHYREAGDVAAARTALLGAVEEFHAVHAYRDAAKSGRDALELWPDRDDPEGRLSALERYGHSAELAGELSEAAKAWKEAAAIRARSATSRALADAQRRLADVYRLQGDRSRALAARHAAARAYKAIGLPAEAASDRIVAALDLQVAGEYEQAVNLAVAALEEAESAGRVDLRARALGVHGAALAHCGAFKEGLDTVQAGLALALEHDLVADAADVYKRLGHVLQSSADYGQALSALDSALGLCEVGGAGSEQADGCRACMVYVLRELGEWDKSAEIAQGLSQAEGSSDDTRVVADGILGSIYGFRGKAAAARRLLQATLALAQTLDQLSMQFDTAAALAWIECHGGDQDAALEQCRFLLELWTGTEDRHYAVWGLRQAATVFARAGDAAGTNACAEALTRISSDTGHPDALAALAHSLGEAALLEHDGDAAVEQFLRAVDLHGTLETPFELAQIRLRAGAALVAVNEREFGLEQFASAYRTARKLGARPLAVRAAAMVAELGESVERRLGRRAAAEHQGKGLSRREVEVLRLAALGRTNREIATELFLSPRTVDMHVRNTLSKLGCRSRIEAARRAHELGLLAA